MANDYYRKLFASLNIAEMIRRGDEFFLIQYAVICGAKVKENCAKITESAKTREDSSRFSYLLQHYINHEISYDKYNSIICETERYPYFEELCKTLNIAKMVSRGDEIFLIKFAMLCGANPKDYIDEVIEATMTRKDSIEVLELLDYFGMKFNSERAAHSAYIAIKNNYLDYAKFLIEHGADSCGLLKTILDNMDIKVICLDD